MKHSLLFLTLVGGLFFSCSSQDATTNPQTIEKIIHYTPQFVNYDIENQSVVDSVFNSNNQYLSKTEYINTPNSITANSFNVSNNLTLRVIDEFDYSGRLTNLTSYGANGQVGWKYRYDYDDVNHTITRNLISGSIVTPIFFYEVNSMGLIYHVDDLTNNIQNELIFDGDKPISIIDLGNPLNTTNITYYSSPKPNNLRLSTVRKNNLVLKFHLGLMVYNADYYCTMLGEHEQVLMTFDGNDYPMTSRRNFIPEGTNSWEDFYYYQ